MKIAPSSDVDQKFCRRARAALAQVSTEFAELELGAATGWERGSIHGRASMCAPVAIGASDGLSRVLAGPAFSCLRSGLAVLRDLSFRRAPRILRGARKPLAWHLLWIALGSAWLLWWVRRPLFIPRYKMLQSGQEASLVTLIDRLAGAAILIGVPLIVLAANFITDRQYPYAIPLQAAMDQIDPLPPAVDAGVVQVKIARAEYNVPARAMILTAQIHNRSERPIRVGEFGTANVRFLNPAVVQSPHGEGAALVASEGLAVDSPDPIAPGETRMIRITAKDSLWQRERLDGLIRDADTRMGGMLFLFDDAGQRYISSVSAAVIPKFD